MNRTRTLLAAAALLFTAGAGAAAPFGGGQLTLEIDGFPPLTVPITSGVAPASSQTVTFSQTNAIVGTTFVDITNAPPIARIEAILTGNEATATGPYGVLDPLLTAGSNRMGLRGVVNVIGYGGNVTLVAVPLSAFGVPGATTSVTNSAGVVVRFGGTGWTTGQVTITVGSTTIMGGTQDATTVTAAGTNNLVGGVGQITFISPSLIRTNLAGDVPTVAALTLTFVPEPSTLLLLGSGILGLAALGTNRARR